MDPTYLYLGVLVFGMNVIPAFMPPTWVVLAFFHLRNHLQLLPVVVIGAVAATSGRIVLFFIARDHFRPFFSKTTQKNYETIGKVFQAHHYITLPLLLLYAFFPLPSNQVYIIAGLANADVRIIATSFFFGRLVGYSFWLVTAHQIVRHLRDIFGSYLQGNIFLGEVIGVVIIFLVGRIDWRRLFRGHLRH